MNTYNRDRLLLEIKAMKHELPQFIFYQNSGEIYFRRMADNLISK